jgi:xanthine dehydrogenase YagT iron-sulfur-binding subunit
VQYEGREITTIEGVDHPLQEAFVRNDGLQCGYCTPGQICSAIGMLSEYEEGAPSAATEHLATTGGEIADRLAAARERSRSGPDVAPVSSLAAAQRSRRRVPHKRKR